MMYEKSSINNAASSAAAGAGAGGSSVINDFPEVSSQSYIISWADTIDEVWKFAVHNYGTGTTTATYNSGLNISEWTLSDDQKAVHGKGFSICMNNNADNSNRFLFFNAEGTFLGKKSLDTDEDFQYTERAIGYLGHLNGTTTFHHFDGYNVRTHTFDVDINNVEIDDGGLDDVTKDGSMIVEAPNNTRFYIARPNGKLVEITSNLSGSSYSADYNTDFILNTTYTTVKIISQEGNLLGTYNADAGMEMDDSTLYGDNCAVAHFTNNNNDGLVVVYDGVNQRFVSSTFSIPLNGGYQVNFTRRDIYNPVSSFGKTLVLASYESNSSTNIGLVATELKLWWLPAGASQFNHVDLSSVGTVSLVYGNADFTSNRSFTLGENPMFMYGPEGSELIVGFLGDTFATQSTGILAASCSNVWGHNIGSSSFAEFDVDYTNDRTWQIYDSNSIVAENTTSDDWDWGDTSDRVSMRNGTLAVLDGASYSNSFVYTTEIGLTAGPTGPGDVLNNVGSGIETGIAYEYQILTQQHEGTSYVRGFHLLSMSGLSEYVPFAGTSSTYNIGSEFGTGYEIGSEMISFALVDEVAGEVQFEFYSTSTLELLHSYQFDDLNDVNLYFFTYDNRALVRYTSGEGELNFRFFGPNGTDVLTVTTNDYNQEANDTQDNS